jgi:aryl sulfotransferase
MAKIYWIASYPKSGNTWTRTFLTNYWRNLDQPVDINELEGGPIASARNLFDESVGLESSDLTSAEIERLRPRVYRAVAEASPENLYLKVHDAYTYTPDGVPLLSKEATAGAIYLIRNPLDVLVSFAHHSARPVEKMVKALNDPDYAFVNDPRRMHNQLVQKLLTWSGHVRSWVDEPGLNLLVLRYEDLHRDPEAAFGAMVRFAGLEFDAERLRKAIRFSSFDVLQAQEREHGFGEKMPLSESFFRKGKIGTWREQVSDELAAQVVQAHRDVMTRFGYLDENGKIVF